LLPLLLLFAWDVSRAMQAGFWIDECSAYWLSQHLAQMVRPPFGLANLSLLYATLLSAFAGAEPPWFEAVARLPSLLAAIGCAAVLYSLSERVNGKGTGWMAALLYAVLSTTLDFATEARPYALAQLVFAGTLWWMHAWLAACLSGGRYLAAHALGLVILVYLQPFFALVWPLCAIYVWFTRPDLRWRYGVALLAAAGCLAPVGYVVWRSTVKVSTIAYLAPPAWRDLAWDLLQDRVGPTLLIVGALAWIAKAWRRPGPLAPWAAIWLAWPLVLFGLARLTGSAFYTPRYLALSAVGFALLGAGGLAAMRPVWRYAGMMLVLLLHVAPGSRARQLRDGDLRPLANWLEFGGGAGAPWLANSLLVESSVPNPAPPAEQLAAWEFAHLSTYPVPNPVFPMPWAFAEFARPALEAQLDGPWKAQPRILAGPLRTPSPAWLVECFVRRGYRYTRLGDMHEFARPQ